MGEEYKDMQEKLSVLFPFFLCALSGQICGGSCPWCGAREPDGREQTVTVVKR